MDFGCGFQNLGPFGYLDGVLQFYVFGFYYYMYDRYDVFAVSWLD